MHNTNQVALAFECKNNHVGCDFLLLMRLCFPNRNLRIREDIAKYLLNLDVNSAHYDPKTRSMREDPLPDMDTNEKFYAVSVLED